MKNLIFLFVVLFASSSVYAQANKMFFGVQGFYNMTDDDNFDSVMGGEGYFGVNLSNPFFTEAYFAYAIYDSEISGIDVTGMHFGAKVGAKFEDMFLVKAGGGFARLKTDIAGSSSSENEFEIVANAGVELPIESIYITILGNYSYIMSDPALMTYGLSAGIKFLF